MFVRTSTRRNKDGTPVRYLQLAHNEWDPARKASRTKVLYNFGVGPRSWTGPASSG